MMNTYFNDRMFNQQYVNPNYYYQNMQQKYNQDQDEKVLDAVKAIHDLCKAIKEIDPSHQEQAFLACLTAMAQELNW